MAKYNPTPQKQQSSLSQDQVDRILKNQETQLANAEREIKLRERELINREKEISLNGKLGEKSIDANLIDRERERNHESKRETRGLIFFGIISVSLLLFFGYLLHIGKDTIVLEILKLGGTALVSGTGAYYVGKAKGRENEPRSSSVPDAETVDYEE